MIWLKIAGLLILITVSVTVTVLIIKDGIDRTKRGNHDAY